jgi:hypothetical protein
MQNKTAVSKKLLCAALLGAFCVAPLAVSTPAAQADPPMWSHKNDHKDHHDKNDHRRGNVQTFTGVVTKVESSSKFDLRVGHQDYDVYPSGRIPRGLHKNDLVRVTGYRYGNNDIRNASVTVVRRR